MQGSAYVGLAFLNTFLERIVCSSLWLDAFNRSPEKSAATLDYGPGRPNLSRISISVTLFQDRAAEG
jgi:hypothetical protein